MKTNMIKIATAQGYDYYVGYETKQGEIREFYCLVPTGQPRPKGGYFSHEYACKIKNAPNLFNNITK
jgi:hypothetical protein